MPVFTMLPSWHCHCETYGVFTRSSKLPANVFKIHVLMLDDNGCLLDVCCHML